MWETRSVELNVSLPRDMAAQLEEVQRTDPELLSRMIAYGLTRRAIYHQLRDRRPSDSDAGAPAMGIS